MSFPELSFLENLLESLKGRARIQQPASVGVGPEKFPIYTVTLGSTDPAAPTFLIVGGVHGQEKIGTQVVLSFLESLTELLHWDELTNLALEKVRVAFLPIVNPVGMFLLRRGNLNRVDIMRNAPLEFPGTTPLIGGQRMSPFIPWYRGPAGGPMEVEAQVLCDFVRKEAFGAKVAITLDCHSGYGAVDRLWFPYSYSLKPFPDLASAFALKSLLDTTYSNHVYKMEPTAQSYTINGDLWDYLYEEHRQKMGGGEKNERRMLPLTLEMGSWLWLKKNPAQLFSSMGLYYPGQLHRHKRILRRHITLLEFLLKATFSSGQWAFPEEGLRQELHQGGLTEWFS